MRADASMSVTRAKVRSGTLSRDQIRRADPSTYAVASGLGPPRVWHVATGAALDGFDAGLAEAGDATGVDRLRAGLDGARAGVASRCDGLIERVLPDAAMVVVSLSDGELHVLSAGPGRVYIQRSGRPRRLTSRDETPGGVLQARPSQCSTPIQVGDLVLAGSVNAFSTASIAKVVSVLSADRNASPAVLASLLTEPAGQAGVGAASIAIRVV